jgi:hypothetical protein
MTLWSSAFFVFALGNPLAERSRRLWLCVGDARGGLFRVCERVLLADAIVLAACGWLVIVLLGLLRGQAIDSGEAARLFAVYVGATLLPVYLSLALSTFHSVWLKVAGALVAVFGIAVWPIFWLRALGVTSGLFGADGPGFSASSLVVLLAVAAVLRGFALQRWGRIDWARLRPRRLA